ncbi:MAG: DNA internalization-related competence protein ComEC/Rec2 [Candidatus Omnitrophota bacterium]
MKRPLLWGTGLFLLGIIVQDLVAIPLSYLIIYFTLFVSLAFLSLKTTKFFLISVACSFALLGAIDLARVTTLAPEHIVNRLPVIDGVTRSVVVRGRVLDEPREEASIYGQKEFRCALRLAAIRGNNAWDPSDGVVNLTLINPRLVPRCADDLILEGVLIPPRQATNPGQFDHRKFLARRLIFYTLTVNEDGFLKRIGRGPVNPITAVAFRTVRYLERLIERYAPGREGAILKAILLGARSEIDPQTNDDFVKTGTVHALVIAGLHLGLLAGIAILVFKILRIPFTVWAPVLIGLSIFYCVMVGGRPPVVRAAIMMIVFLSGRLVRREQDLLTTLAFCALLIAAINPQDLFTVGFQLSFMTVGSIISLTPLLEKYLDPVIRGDRLRPAGARPWFFQACRYAVRAAVVSFTAWVGSAPLVAQYFNIVSPVTVLANLVVVPWLFIVLASAVAFIASALLAPWLGLLFAQTSLVSIDILTGIAAFFARLPLAYSRVRSPGWIAITLFYAAIFLFINRRFLRLKAAYFLFGALIVVNVIVWGSALSLKNDRLKVSFLDVGKGDSCVVQFPRGGVMVIDGGEATGTDMGRTVLGRYLASEGISRVDLAVSTHPHTDHVGGLGALLEDFEVGGFVENGDAEMNPWYPRAQTIIKEKRIPRMVLRRGDEIRGFAPCRISVLNPPSRRLTDLNNNSLVIKLVYKNFSVLFCGDIQEYAARDLALNYGNKLRSDILKVPHHGGDLGEEAKEFITEISPRVALISSRGRKLNDRIAALCDERHISILRTDLAGCSTVESDGECYVIQCSKNN